MSCSCNCNPCQCSHVCDPNNEPLSSSLNNLINSFFGSLTKSCVNGQVVWVLPCDLDAGNPSFPRLPGEGLACYFNRFITSFLAAQQVSIGNKGYRSTALNSSNVNLNRDTDLINQDFTGTLTAPVDITLETANAVNGDEFYLSFTALNITAVNNIEILSDSNSLLVINTAGALTGYLKAVFTGTDWKLTLTSTNIV